MTIGIQPLKSPLFGVRTSAPGRGRVSHEKPKDMQGSAYTGPISFLCAGERRPHGRPGRDLTVSSVTASALHRAFPRLLLYPAPSFCAMRVFPGPLSRRRPVTSCGESGPGLRVGSHGAYPAPAREISAGYESPGLSGPRDHPRSHAPRDWILLSMQMVGLRRIFHASFILFY